MAEQTVVEWLRAEVDKRLGPWQGVDRKGNPEMKEQLYTCITLLPSQAMELLAILEPEEQDRVET